MTGSESQLTQEDAVDLAVHCDAVISM